MTQGLPLHEAKPWLNSSLPRNLVPVHYEVDLKPILTPDASGTFWFNGSSKVTFTVKKKTDKVLIHSRDLDYNSLKLTSEQVGMHYRTIFGFYSVVNARDISISQTLFKQPIDCH